MLHAGCKHRLESGLEGPQFSYRSVGACDVNKQCREVLLARYGGQPGFHLFLDELLWLPEELRQDITERFKSTDPEQFTLFYGR